MAVIKQLDEIDKQKERLDAIRRERQEKRKAQQPINHEDRRKEDRRKSKRG